MHPCCLSLSPLSGIAETMAWAVRLIGKPTAASLLDMCTASSGRPLGQLRPVFRLACMSSLLLHQDAGSYGDTYWDSIYIYLLR